MAQALAVEAGRVMAVGGRDELLTLASGAELVELPGATVVPGIVDAHIHLAWLGKSLATVELRGASTLAELLQRLQRAGPASYQGDWLVGRGWDQNEWSDHQGFPHRAQLDALFPRTPVYLTRVDGHAAWVNGEALRRAGIGRGTADPPGGRIVRDERGEPTGVLVDNAMEAVERLLPPLDQAQRESHLRAALSHCASMGLTEVHDAGMDLPTFELLRRWDEAGRLPLRVYAMAAGQGDEASEYLERGTFHGRHLTLRAVKFLLDGALGSRGAAFDEPYDDEPSSLGLLLLSPDELEQKSRAFAERGFQVAVHAIGDRANRLVIDLLERLERERPGGRHRVEHAQVLHPSDISRLARANLVASMQPLHATRDMAWIESRIGRERIQGAYAWKSLLEAGAVLAFGSDAPVESANPLWGIHAARTRQDAEGQPPGGWLAQERLDGLEALAGFTTGAAWAAFAESRRGVLRPGADADFTAFSVDPVASPPEQLLTGRALLTVVAGHPVHRASS